MAASTNSPRLTILGGPCSGQELALEETVDNILIGSDPSCRFHIDLPGVRPIHARLWVDRQGLTVYDTDAPEGIYLNDDRVERSAPVRNGDILWLGPPGGDGVVMIQCRVPTRTGAASAPATPAPAPSVSPAADETATMFTPPSDEPHAFTDTIAFTTDVTPVPAAAPADFGEAETVWLTPDAVHVDEAPPEPQPEPLPESETIQLETPPGADDFVEPVVDASDAETMVLPTAAQFVAEEPAPVEGLETSGAPVKFELDEPPPALTGQPGVFEEDIEEAAVAFVDEGVSSEEAAPESAPPAPRPAPVPEPPAAAAAPRPAAPRPRAATPAPETPPPSERPMPARPPAARVTAAPVPRPASRTVAPRPDPATPTPAGPARGSSSSGRWVALAAVALIVLAGGGFAVYKFVLAPAPAPPEAAPSAALPAPPVSLAEAPPTSEPTEPAPEPSAPVEEAVTIVPTPTPAPGATAASPTPAPKGTPTPRPTPSARPGATPPPTPGPEVAREQQTAGRVAALIAQADAALGERRYDDAATAYAQALQLDPQNTLASTGRARALAGAAAARRTFVAGRSQLTGTKSGKKGPAGFDDEDVQIAKAPDYSGRLEFEVAPRSVKPGDSFSVRVFLINDGKKDFKIAALNVLTTSNGEKSGGGAPAAAREVAPQKRVQIHELSGVWKDGTNSWSLEASVTSTHGEAVRNTLTWR